MVALSKIQASIEPSRFGTGTFLAAGINAIVVSLTINSNSGFPATGPFTIVVDSEHMSVTAGFATTTWTVTRGTDGTTAATHAINAIVYYAETRMMLVNMAPSPDNMLDRFNPAEMRYSFEQFYRTVVTRGHAELKGVASVLSYEDAAWWFQFALKGGVTGALTNVAAYTYTFPPNLSADDVATARLVWGTDTAAYAIPGSFMDTFKIEWKRGTDSVIVTSDWLGQQLQPAVFAATGATQRVVEDVSPATTALYIDTTTIGTTITANFVNCTVSMNNQVQQLWYLNGSAYPLEAARGTRFLDIEIDGVFNSTAEYLAATSGAAFGGIERKLRVVSTGSAIAGTTPSTNKAVSFDFYGYWDTFPFNVDRNVWLVKFKGRSVYDAGAGNSFNASVVNALATLP